MSTTQTMSASSAQPATVQSGAAQTPITAKTAGPAKTLGFFGFFANTASMVIPRIGRCVLVPPGRALRG